MKAISLFSGMGGDTLGMKNAGVDVTNFNEIDKTFIETHELNFPNCKFIGESERDIMKIPDSEIAQIEDINLIFAGFPCQGFSNAGKKLPSDPRNTLFKEFIRFTKILKPKFIIGENVKGLLSRKTDDDELFIDKIQEAFTEIGYRIKYKVFKASNYGVPQLRERLIIIGVRNDFENYVLKFPDEVNNQPNLENIVKFDMEGTIPFDFSDLEIPDDCIIKDMNNEETHRNPHPYLVSKVNAPESKRYYKEKYYDSLFSFSKRDSPIHCEIINIKKPSKTIICTYNHQPRLFVPIQNKKGTFIRALRPYELKQIQGFPADFELSGNEKKQIIQIGNAVPPPLVKLVTETLISEE